MSSEGAPHIVSRRIPRPYHEGHEKNKAGAEGIAQPAHLNGSPGSTPHSRREQGRGTRCQHAGERDLAPEGEPHARQETRHEDHIQSKRLRPCRTEQQPHGPKGSQERKRLNARSRRDALHLGGAKDRGHHDERIEGERVSGQHGQDEQRAAGRGPSARASRRRPRGGEAGPCAGATPP